MNKFLGLMTLLLALVASACVVDNAPPRPVNGDYIESRYYTMERLEYVTDASGYTQVADCVADVLFTSWIDSTCNAFIESQETTATLGCTYYDAAGYAHDYDSFYDFPLGTISEVCTFGKPAPVVGKPSSQPLMIPTKKVSENLGKNVTMEEFLKVHGPITTTLNVNKPITRLVTKQELEKASK